MAHVRYATQGRKDEILDDAHPHVLGGQVENRGNHILIRDCQMAAVHNGQVDSAYFDGLDLSGVDSTCDTEALLYLYRRHGEQAFLRTVPGAYTMAIADWRKRDVIVLRDRTGIKPGVLGWKDGKYGVASEDIAFRKNGGEYIEDLEPGSAYYLSPEGEYSRESLADPRAEPLLLRVELHLRRGLHHQPRRRPPDPREPGGDPGRGVRPLRRGRGHLPAALPRGGGALLRPGPRPALHARVLQDARRARLPGIDRRGPEAVDRRQPASAAGTGPRACRAGRCCSSTTASFAATTSSAPRNLLYDDLGVRKAYVVSYTPPIGIIPDDGVPRGCMFGVDMPPTPPEGEEFIARGREPGEIGDKLGMPVVYISTKGMLRAFEGLGLGSGQLCTYCIGGGHPLRRLRGDRRRRRQPARPPDHLRSGGRRRRRLSPAGRGWRCDYSPPTISIPARWGGAKRGGGFAGSGPRGQHSAPRASPP